MAGSQTLAPLPSPSATFLPPPPLSPEGTPAAGSDPGLSCLLQAGPARPALPLGTRRVWGPREVRKGAGPRDTAEGQCPGLVT